MTDLVNLFGRLRSHGLKVGLATMDSSAAAEAQLAAFGVRRLMDFVCGYDSGYGHKPGPGMVEAFCREVNCRRRLSPWSGIRPTTSTWRAVRVRVLPSAC